MLNSSALTGRSPELLGMEYVLDVSELPLPSCPRNSVNWASSAVDPKLHVAATVGPDPSKSSSSSTTSG